MQELLWQSWAKAGQIVAAILLKRDINKVALTTNHLESFNRVLKKTHLENVQKGGQQLCLDVLIRTLVFRVLPAIF